ncbi:pentapeptide repeat-containing protein [Streptomyces aidingensis]|uniref:Uncharacterized protein YjbI, contains pentapeptide repeats n=1 Tax=Streptomyces aidingensis TaxID=910347 RepID=A0A1I1TB98_9ACTN|nr:pentapeptide repeat-containing protein [Streptomyces aidingensis]SFD55845.1 Uncharacterized protein YjbI, contains pentapeptide repeats [Streptomyces aidingensis]
MTERTFGRVTATLPDLDEPGLYLTNRTSLESGRGILQDFQYTGADLRDLDLTDTRLITGRITDLSAKRTHLHGARADSIEFAGCDLGTAEMTDSRLTRVLFRDCKLMGATLNKITLENAVFDTCRLDYATLTEVRATGPVLFTRCVLTEAVLDRCDLTGAVFDQCTLRLTEFGTGRYHDTDLSGSDLSTVRGVTNLRGTIIGRHQQTELAHALTAELDITYSDTLAPT